MVLQKPVKGSRSKSPRKQEGRLKGKIDPDTIFRASRSSRRAGYQGGMACSLTLLARGTGWVKPAASAGPSDTFFPLQPALLGWTSSGACERSPGLKGQRRVSSALLRSQARRMQMLFRFLGRRRRRRRRSHAATRGLYFCAFGTLAQNKLNVTCQIAREGNCLSCLQKNGGYAASISLAPIRNDGKRDASQQPQRAGAAPSAWGSYLTAQSFSINNNTTVRAHPYTCTEFRAPE